MNQRYTLHHGDCVEVMRAMPDNSVDSIVTDPPYGLEFMGKEWDAPWKQAGTVLDDPASVGGFQDGAGGNPFSRSRIRFGREGDAAVGFQMWCEQWAREALRVLKPGGYLLAFSGSRTYHRMAVAIEDAGFEIRDQIMWIYGSGFPKSLDVSKAIDKAAGAEREVVGSRPLTGNGKTMKSGFHQPDGSGAGETIKEDVYEYTAPATPEAQKWSGYGTALKPAHEPIVVARKPLQGTVAANVLAHGVGALNIDGCRVVGEPVAINKLEEWSGFGQKERPDYQQEMNTQGRWPANVIHDGSDEVVALFPEAGNKWKRNYGSEDYNGRQYEGGSFGGGGYNGQNTYADSGSAARFFYCAKANKRDRNEGLDGFEARFINENTPPGSKGANSPRAGAGRNGATKNHHPTVKPTDLMRYLIRLVTPQGATVLDPFMGSGSTGKAAMYEGVNFIGIEQDADYLAIAQARIEYALNKPLEDQLFERTPPTTEQLIAQDQLAFPLVEGETA